jgi:MYXO-CTERM domain-containing protein
MKTYLAVAAGFAGLLAARSVFPCGAPFGMGIDVNPQQDIIVVHKNGVETYVFQPTFCGTASSFGLILPVPSSLSKQPETSDQQAFTTVADLSKPLEVTVTSCLGGRTGSTGAAGGVGGSSGSHYDTTMVASGHVGLLDWVQLKADTETSFTDWLNTNNYPYSPAASSVFSYYVQKGWYFVAFRINQGAMPDGGSTSVCKALGPIKMSFPTDVPVVPTRMASVSTPPTNYYATGFSWRIFGITSGDQQLSFTNGANYNRVLGYSGALTANNVSSLAGLAQAGDRLSKLTLTFSYGSADPDIGLSLAAASDYRETHTTYTYVYCPDPAVIDAPPVDTRDAAVASDVRDAAPDLAPPAPLDADLLLPDAGLVVRADASSGPDGPVSPNRDAGVYVDLGLSPDVGSYIHPTPDVRPAGDLRPSVDALAQVAPDASAKPDALLAKADAAGSPIPKDAPVSEPVSGGGGCSVAGKSTSSGFLALALLGLVGWARRRKMDGRS